MQKPRKIPQRMCVGCREKRDKKDLLRVVRTPEGQLVLDATGKKSGRGAYVCRDPQCLKKARKSRAGSAGSCLESSSAIFFCPLPCTAGSSGRCEEALS